MWDPRAPAVGDRAADLPLLDENGRPVQLSLLPAPLLVIVFRSPEDEASLRLLRDYRDYTLALRRAGVSIIGVTQAEPSTLAYMRSERGLGFPLYAATLSPWGLADSNALLLLDRNLRVVQRAAGERAPAGAMLAFVRRGQLRGPSLLARVAQFLMSLQLRPRHP